ncbi:MAG: iron ABC transporter permease [Flavobacteriaceae bacterium]|nr:iron ABC transporter permease [Flavobacteriaceae bacterium]
MIPLFISPYILAVSWKDFFYFLFDSTSFISSYFGVILVLTIIFTPLSMLIIGSAFSNINVHLEEAGMVITNIRSVVVKIILPLIKHALLSSFVLVFIFSISEFSVPAFFGVKVFTTEIFTQFSAFYNHSFAILQSTLLVFVCILLLVSEGKYIADAPFISVGSKGMNKRSYDFKKWNQIGLVMLFIWFFISVVMPFIVLFVQSFKGGTSKFIQAFELLLPTFGSSIGLAFLGALIIVFIGFTAAFFSVRKRSMNGSSFEWLLLIIFAIPSTIFGISLIKFYNHPMLEFIYSSYAIILIAYVGKFSFISSKLIGNAMKQIPKSLDEVAKIQGISPLNRLRKILIPLIMPSLFISFVISFIFSLGELGTTIMIYPPGTEIMPIKVFTIMANAPQSLTSSMTLIVFSVTLLVIMSFFFILKPFIKKYHYAID